MRPVHCLTGRSTVNQFVARIHSCETARDMRETAVSRWGVSRETARDSARQRETARDSARQPRDSRESDVNPCSRLVNLRPSLTGPLPAPSLYSKMSSRVPLQDLLMCPCKIVETREEPLRTKSWMQLFSRAPKMCSTYFGGFKDKNDNCSITIGFQTKNSSDLEPGTVPRSIAVEFFVWNPIVIEL